jgi:hypothetical protein
MCLPTKGLLADIGCQTQPAAEATHGIPQGHPVGATCRFIERLARDARAGDTPPDRAPEPRQAATHTAPWPRFPSAMRPWTPQHDGLQRYKVTHDGTEQKRPASARIRS